MSHVSRIGGGLLAAVLLIVSALPAAAVEATKVVSAGGIEAWLDEDHSIPVLSVSIGFRGGAALDPAGKEGVATFASGLIDEGAGDLDSLAFRTILENKAITVSFSANRDAFTGTLRTLTENRAEAFDLMRLALTAPRFDAEPVERVRSQILTSLAMNSQDPQTIASEAWSRAVFPDHPYGRPAEGTVETVKALTVADLRTFLAGQVTRDRLKIGVSGDITAAELAPLLDATFGDLPQSGDLGAVADVVPKTGEVIVIDKAIPQSVAVFGEPGIDREDPDFYAAYVVNYILGGGGFASRLMEEVREKRGLAYSVYSYLYPLDHTALIIGGVATNNARMAESLATIRQEWARMAAEGPTEEELNNARTYLTGAWPLRFTSSGSVAAILMSMQLDGYPMDHLKTRNDKINAVTLDDARRAASRLLDPDRLTIVVVGQPDGVEGRAAAPQ